MQKEDALAYLKDNFAFEIEGWRWSIDFVEKSYSRLSNSISIIRVPSLGPTIIDYEGYLTKFNYFTYLVYQMGNGMIKNIDGNRQNKVDIVPSDFVANFLIVVSLRKNSSRAETLNLSTCTRNYITLQQFLKYGQEAWEEYGKKVPKISVVENKLLRRLKHSSELLPSEIKRRLGSVLDVVSWKI
jgi:hypothetical protein